MLGRYVADSVRDFERAWWAHRAVFEHDMAKRLEELRQRVMVLCTKDDIWGPTLRSKHHLKNGTFVERPDWGHWVYEAATEEFGALVRNFLDAP
jgi:pimeloyl-ACP methyl ester carboxylesterase